MPIKPLSERRAEKQSKKLARLQSANSRAEMASKAEHAAKIHMVRAGMLGFTLEWIDTDPLGGNDETATWPVASNSNAMQFGCAQKFWDEEKFRNWIVKNVFTWEARVALNFKLLRPRPDKTHRQDIIVVRHTCRIRDPHKGDDTAMNNEIERHIMAEFMANAARPDGDKNKGAFEYAEYKIVCVGH